MTKENFDNNGYDYVDLGLPSGTLWATMNVGASNPLDYGLYFKWGETKGYAANQAEIVYTIDNYKLSINTSDIDSFTKYNSEKTILKLEDDAAHVNMGGDWHMPSPKQINELLDNTTSEWTTLNNVSYMTFTSKKDTSKSIFIPAAGYTMNSGLVYGNGIEGNFWPSMLSDNHISNGYTLYFYSGGAELGTDNRNYKFPVRGVINKKSDNSKEKKNNMKENLNLVEILKNVPEGTKLWSPIYGECTFLKVDESVMADYSDGVDHPKYPIICEADGAKSSFTKEGKLFDDNNDTECILFPSKENRDWSTFNVPKQHKHFEPYQKVLVNIYSEPSPNNKIWFPDIYLFYEEKVNCHRVAINKYIRNDSNIIPFEGNEDKVGKNAE